MKTYAKSVLLNFLLIALSASAFSQDDIIAENLLENIHDWREGTVRLIDGTELAGLLRFDDHTGILTYQNGDISKTFIAKSAAGFEFYDEQLKKQRVFYSLEYDYEKGSMKFHFFEVLKEFTAFAVLSKVDPLEVVIKNNGGAPYYTPSNPFGVTSAYSSTEVHQTETIYFMDRNGEIKPYVRILEKDISGLFARKRTKNRFIDEALLEEYTATYFSKLEGFAIKNELSFKRKNDLIKVLDFYHELIGN